MYVSEGGTLAVKLSILRWRCRPSPSRWPPGSMQLSILRWRCGGGGGGGGATRLWGFQYSVGDAVITANAKIELPEKLHFQYSVGDANVTSAPVRLVRTLMYFQYSVGDAYVFNLVIYLVQHVSFNTPLEMRRCRVLAQQHGHGLSILRWRCAWSSAYVGLRRGV